MTQFLTENHASVYKFKAREQYIEIYPLNKTYVHKSVHLCPRKNSILYSYISSLEVLNLGSRDAQEVFGKNSGPLILKGNKVLPPQKLCRLRY